MKKLVFLLLFATISICSFAQSKFVAPNFSYVSKTTSYGVEAGLCYSDIWLSANYSYTPSTKENYVGINLYNKITQDHKISLQLVNSMQMNTNTQFVYYNPGGSIVYELSPLLSPQFTVSVPVIKGTVPVCSFSLMINFK